MNGASKILTVSYGTFSCTLEGFDDPFNTMKAIAEYFRDLAAEDRYFGAEPPTPDAAMLHRIAEREIQRRVEAKIQENGVVLRASDGAVPLVAEAPVSAPPVAEALRPSVAPAPVVAPPVVAAPAAEPAVAPAALPVAETVAEKLSRLRSEVAATPAAAAPAATMPFVSFAIPDYIEDDLTDSALDGLAFEGDAPLADDLADVIEPEVAPAAAVAEDVAEDLAEAEDYLPETETVAAETVDGGADVPVAEEDALAAVMAAVPSEAAPVEADDLAVALAADAEENAAPAPVLPETVDIAADAYADDLPGSLLAALATKAEAAMDEAAAQDGAQGDAAPVVADAAPVAQTDDLDAAFLASLQDLTVEELAEAPPEVEAESATVVPEDSEAVVAEAAPVAAPERPEDAVDAVAEGIAAEAVPQPAAPEPRFDAVEKVQRARARVIRIRRGETESEAFVAEAAAPVAEQPAAPVPAAPVSATPEPETIFAEQDVAAEPGEEAEIASIFAEVAEEAATPAEAAAQDEALTDALDALLSAEDEAELQRELAALRDNDQDVGADRTDQVSQLVMQQDARRSFEGPSADEALGRLMQQTASEMEGSETKRRQSAIAHLKAAVAATVAERKVTGEATADTATVSRLARYRDDLARVVKSALPGRGGVAAPNGERPAPLVLVSEQRIDRPRAAPAPQPATAPGPVRPRRVTASTVGMRATAEAAQFGFDEDEDDLVDEPAATTAPQGFSEFVERVGAQSLEEILEASAAYLAGVEGRPQFSRTQLMRRASVIVPGGTLQREDGLRSFGTLLRDGRIAKIKRGVFTLSDGSSYLAEARKITG